MNNDSPIHLQDICQGNGAGPNIWVTVSSPLIKMMQGSGHGINLEAMLSQEKYILVVLVFIDNTDIVEGDLTRNEITTEDVYIRIQKAINRWEG